MTVFSEVMLLVAALLKASRESREISNAAVASKLLRIAALIESGEVVYDDFADQLALNLLKVAEENARLSKPTKETQ